MKTQKTPNNLSRRTWLRDAAIAATGAVVVPSLLTSCSDHRVEPGIGDPGNDPYTEFELFSAAENLKNLRDFNKDLYLFMIGFEAEAWADLQSGTVAPESWKDFIIDIFVDIAVGILDAAAVATAVELPFAGAAIAIAGESIKKWTSGDRPTGLAGAVADFATGVNQMQLAIYDTLNTLIAVKDNYANLRNAFAKGPIADPNDPTKKYTLRNLAEAQIPNKDLDGGNYTTQFNAAYKRFRQYYWNVMLVKTAEMNYKNFELYDTISPARHARDTHYPANPATYMRGTYYANDIFYNRSYYLTVDGRELSPALGRKLFIDDTPGNIINKDALFPRDYVFKQFRTERYDFGGYYDVRRDLNLYGYPDYSKNYDPSTEDYVFTGGAFPQLIKK
ncbi:hypothetical protein [Spirosoma utsteinense]|uniref:Uncharacterized protein n=1 Tax=Spirosoma utsteinense TaxID=2585773 RepID=A0ABR6W6T9_9BACT|nr:hypothetical protein [Spirosoma utsteinense]MBC3787882.1 hypothetical protein [Spirosoma utsteinense]MBC3792197.1 hypothetical protein [Spirosoma utsteinense]